MHEAPALDIGAIKALKAINPDDGGEFLRELVQIFFADTPRRLAEIRTALAANDAGAVTRAAHSIKGSAGNFGAASFVALNEQVEALGREENLAPVKSLLPRLEAEYERVQAALRAQL